MSKLQEFWDKRKKQLLITLLISFILPYITFISIPLEVYSNNMEEFIFSLGDFFPMGILLAVLTTIVLFIIIFPLPPKANKIVLYILLSLEFLLFIQGTYLNSASSLGGDNMVESVSTLSIVLNTIVWIAIISAFIILAILKDKKGIIKTVSYVLVAILIFAPTVNIVAISTTEGVFESRSARMLKQDPNYKDMAFTNLNLTTLSSSENVLYIVVDRFDELYAEKAQNDNPAVFDKLTGFTWFQDYTSLYGHTFPAVTSMLTEQKMDMSTQKRKDYFKTAYSANTPLAVLNENNYNVNLYTQEYYTYSGVEIPNFVKNFNEGEFKTLSSFRLAVKMGYISLVRSIPLIFKNFVGRDLNSYTCNEEITLVAENGAEKFSCNNKKIWDEITSSQFTTSTNKNFTFLHMIGCHEIMYDDEWNKVQKKDRTNITRAVENSFVIINKYIEELKAKNIYDKTTIIIVGDHAAQYDDFDKANEPRLTALFVKPANSENESLKISKAQVCQKNIWPTVFKDKEIITTFASESSVFDVPETVDQTREFIWQTFEANQTMQYTYQIVGNGKNFDNWKIVKEEKFNHCVMD